MSFGVEHGFLVGLGGMATAAPIILHLIMRQKPKIITFPAIRLLAKRRRTAVRTLQLRHLLVLLLRIAALFLLGLALARPKLQTNGLVSIDRSAPTAVALIFDTSPSMDLKQEGKTRLEAAKELSKAILADFSEGAEFTIIDSSTGAPSAVVPYAVALDRVERLEIQPSQRSVSVSLENALRSMATTQLPRGEVYVFTDFAEHGWSIPDAAAIRNAFEQAAAPVKVYVMNLGVEKPHNASLMNLRISQQTIPEGGKVRLQTTATNAGPEAEGMVEVTLDANIVAQQPIRLAADAAEELSFDIPTNGLGVHQGSVRLKSADLLPFDQERFFTVEGRQPIPLLVAAPSRQEAYNWVNALDPEAVRGRMRSSFQVTAVYGIEKMLEKDFSGFAGVVMLDMGTVPDAVWAKLQTFAESGGGVFVGLGPHVEAANYNSAAAQKVLPAKLEKAVKAEPSVTISLDRASHPLLATFVDLQRNDFGQGYVVKYWKTVPQTGSQSVLKYTNEDPALVERTLGKAGGKSLLLTTAAHYSPRDYWSELPLRWSYLLLAEGVSRHLSGSADLKFNFVVGASALVDLPKEGRPSALTVIDPKREVTRTAAEDLTISRVRLASSKWIGHYLVEGAAPNPSKFQAGFSVNVPDSESNLDPADAAKVALVLPKDALTVAKDFKTLQRSVSSDRVGADLFPYVMLLLLTIVSVESFLANRFYKREPEEDAAA